MNVAIALPHSLREIFEAFAQQEAFDRGAGFHRMEATDRFFVGGGCEVFRIERPFPNISICQPFIFAEWLNSLHSPESPAVGHGHTQVARPGPFRKP